MKSGSKPQLFLYAAEVVKAECQRENFDPNSSVDISARLRALRQALGLELVA